MERVFMKCLVLLVVLVVVQGLPTNINPKKGDLVDILKKALTTLQDRQREGCDDVSPDLDFETLEYLYTMPNRYYLQEQTFRRMLMPLPLTPEELTDVFHMDGAHTQMVESMAVSMQPIDISPATYATAITMEMVPIILDGRMRCPSTVLNKFMIRLWDRQYQQFISTTSDVYRQIEKTAKAVFPLFETMPDELDRLLTLAVEEMHRSLFNDTMTLTLAQELRDVANVTHYMYRTFYAMRERLINQVTPEPFMTVMNKAVNEAGVKCHNGEELFGQHRIANWIFMNAYEDMEIEHVCHYVGEFIYYYMARRVEEIPGVDMDWLHDNLHWEHLHGLCIWIKDFIHEEVFPSINYYHTLVENKMTTEFLGLFDFFGPNTPERMMLEQVLVRLGWPAPNTPINPNDPFVTPDTPFVTPDTPFVTPDTPFVTPDAPFVTPNEPFETDDSFITPDTPFVTPGMRRNKFNRRPTLEDVKRHFSSFGARTSENTNEIKPTPTYNRPPTRVGGVRKSAGSFRRFYNFL